MRIVPLALLLIAAPGSGAGFPPSPHGRLTTVPGTCAFTRIFWVGQRLGDPVTLKSVPDSGSAIVLVDGVYGVSYGQEPAVNRSRRGDPVLTCLAKLPRHCPPGDHRGKMFTTTNLRTEESWTLPDAQHMCGGA